MDSKSWAYITIMAIFALSTVAYAFHDGGDPFVAAVMVSFVVSLMA